MEVMGWDGGGGMGWTGVGMEMVWSGEGTEMEYGKSWDGGGMGEERSRDGGWGKREGWRVGWSMGWSRKGAEMEMGWKWDGVGWKWDGVGWGRSAAAVR